MRAQVPTPLRVKSVRRETADTVTLHLDASTLDGGWHFAPGQFAMLYAFGVGEVPISISGDPARPEVLVQTVRAVGAVSAALARTPRGGVVGVRGPFGSAWPLEEAKGGDVLLIAGGLGLPPLRPALYHLLRNRSEYGRVTLLIGSRAPENLLFRPELERWQAMGPERLRVEVTVDRAPSGWSGSVGVVTELIPDAIAAPERTLAMGCGPEVMMRFAARTLNRAGVPDARIYFSMERNMKCAVALCGHCQLGPHFVCKDGPVLRADRLGQWFFAREA